MNGLFTLASGAVSNGVLDEATLNLIKAGMEQLSGTVGQVLTIAVPVIVGVIALTAGVNYALRKVHSVISNAQ